MSSTAPAVTGPRCACGGLGRYYGEPASLAACQPGCLPAWRADWAASACLSLVACLPGCAVLCWPRVLGRTAAASEWTCACPTPCTLQHPATSQPNPPSCPAPRPPFPLRTACGAFCSLRCGVVGQRAPTSLERVWNSPRMGECGTWDLAQSSRKAGQNLQLVAGAALCRACLLVSPISPQRRPPTLLSLPCTHPL